MDSHYEAKYLKYKAKYLKLKHQLAGQIFFESISSKEAQKEISEFLKNRKDYNNNKFYYHFIKKRDNEKAWDEIINKNGKNEEVTTKVITTGSKSNFTGIGTNKYNLTNVKILYVGKNNDFAIAR